jgi:hypothetical protein
VYAEVQPDDKDEADLACMEWQLHVLVCCRYELLNLPICIFLALRRNSLPASVLVKKIPTVMLLAHIAVHSMPFYALELIVVQLYCLISSIHVLKRIDHNIHMSMQSFFLYLKEVELRERGTS